ncbi:winged helix-turn-helix transcriptional regulator [Occultella kanbiaonis]|uniref:winged helix-turn-helix transcriptional regulator n=1 Tax=Occultella kanbiaonis TaxID=2675754 RepID=UPI0013CFC78B|nr:helix-turn-helix domain-containing protein [Occultella kanbiaonis]
MTDPLAPDMFEELCPSGLTPFRLSEHKWSALVLRCLKDGPRRFSELRIPLHRVTPRVLTRTLRSLERDGLISRSAGPGPTRVTYALTGLGRSILVPLAAVCDWTAAHFEDLIDARERYEGAPAVQARSVG